MGPRVHAEQENRNVKRLTRGQVSTLLSVWDKQEVYHRYAFQLH